MERTDSRDWILADRAIDSINVSKPWAQARESSRLGKMKRERSYLKGHIEIDRERCKGCTFCIEFCPKKSIYLSEELNLKGYFVAAYDRR